jgi:predicted GIY-YIG superfamily endonuclease
MPAGLTRGSIVASITDMSYYVYVLASKRNGTLYIGMSNDLVRRIFEHRQGAAEGFTKNTTCIASSTLKLTATSGTPNNANEH